MIEKTLCVIDPNLVDLVGHYYEYDLSLRDVAEKNGYKYLVLANKRAKSFIDATLPVKRVFSKGIWERSDWVTSIPRIGWALDALISNVQFFCELLSAISISKVNNSWIVFCQMVSHKQLLALSIFLKLFPRKRSPKLVVLFRFSASWIDCVTARAAFKLLESESLKNNLVLCTDSHRLAQEHRKLTSLPFFVFPIAHTYNCNVEDTSSYNTKRSMLNLVSLGNARDEKGIIEILDAVKILYERGELHRYQFFLQVNDTTREVMELVDKIKGLCSDNILFIMDALSSDQYYELLQKSDVVLIPYWRDVYKSRTSGVFTEALAAGKPVIVTEDTWMSDQLMEFGSGVTCKDRDAGDLVRAIFELTDNIDDISTRSRLSAEEWRKKHNPDELFKAITSEAVKPFKQKIENVAVIFPFPSMARNYGAALRTGLMIEHIKNKYKTIKVLSPGKEHLQRVDNVEYLNVKQSKANAFYVLFVKSVFFFLFRAYRMIRNNKKTWHNNQHLIWWQYEYIFNRALVRDIENIVKWADIVLLEYSFWARPVKKACQKHNVRFILTDHDVVAHQIPEGCIFRNAFMEEELNALRIADIAVCVSPSDALFFKSKCIDIECIPHGIELPVKQFLSKDHFRELVFKNSGYRLPEDNICLFIGSEIKPNIHAVDQIRVIKDKLKSDFNCDKVNFVIVGDCCENEQTANFISFGRVSAETLRYLYELADIILIPLKSGTGASLKTIEAMSYGKAIIGTDIGFRGYDVSSGKECIIENDIDNYPKLLINTLNNYTLLKSIGENARNFAETYDFRIVYERYIKLMVD